MGEEGGNRIKNKGNPTSLPHTPSPSLLSVVPLFPVPGKQGLLPTQKGKKETKKNLMSNKCMVKRCSNENSHTDLGKGKKGKKRERKGKKGKERERKGKKGKERERKGKKGKERKGKKLGKGESETHQFWGIFC